LNFIVGVCNDPVAANQFGCSFTKVGDGNFVGKDKTITRFV